MPEQRFQMATIAPVTGVQQSPINDWYRSGYLSIPAAVPGAKKGRYYSVVNAYEIGLTAAITYAGVHLRTASFLLRNRLSFMLDEVAREQQPPVFAPKDFEVFNTDPEKWFGLEFVERDRKDPFFYAVIRERTTFPTHRMEGCKRSTLGELMAGEWADATTLINCTKILDDIDVGLGLTVKPDQPFEDTHWGDGT